ncbi:MAG: Gfo/Idh/MocA family oxidoreductase [Saprospiraceae bacterium]
MNSSFNWGIIGPGKIAHKFAHDLQFIPRAKLHAVASRDGYRAATFAKQFGAPYHFGNYADILTCPNLDAVYIATPHAGHFENTILCLEKGIPVLCEKPLAMNSRQVELMIAAAKRSGTFLMEALWTRFTPSMQKVVSLIREGKIGEILGVKADFGFRAAVPTEHRILNKALGGGALLDVGIYPAFLALLLLGKPAEVKAMGRIGSTGVDEETHALLRFQGGQLAHLFSSIVSHTQTEAFIYGEEGTLHLHSRWHEQTNLSFLKSKTPPEVYHFEKLGFGYHYEALEVMSCIEAGKIESELWPHSLSMELILLLDAIRREIGLIYPEDE